MQLRCRWPEESESVFSWKLSTMADLLFIEAERNFSARGAFYFCHLTVVACDRQTALNEMQLFIAASGWSGCCADPSAGIHQSQCSVIRW